MAGKSAPKMAPGTTTTGGGKTSIRTTMTPVFGKRGGGKKAPKRGGRGR